MNNGWRPTEEELYLFNTGKFYHSYQKFGAHFTREDGVDGCGFVVWAPGVKSVCVTGAFCGWQEDAHPMVSLGDSGVWALFIPDVPEGTLYKYVVETRDGRKLYKADPFAFSAELRPGTASKTAELAGFDWTDGRWMAARRRRHHFRRPMNIYELHLGSWQTPPEDAGGENRTFYSYREIADRLVPYLTEMGYTHVELMPVTEHPFDGSWGYQTTGYFAPTSRYGAPHDFMALVDSCHAAGISVIMDWAPGHFCRDAHGLGQWIGDKLYEAYDHQQWGTYTFDFARTEVRGFLLSSAMYWLERYHIDGIRVDGVSSMLYLNFGVENPADKRRNARGGEENLDAIAFLREFNEMVGRYFPGVITIAEESSAWPLVTYPPEQGGLGFHYKWDMGWMNDTLRYVSTDFPYRGGCHNLLTFSMMYAFSENFILPLSHDEVVHGKRSLIGRMPGDYWRQFAGLRALALYQMTHPGGKLSFMGSEFAQFIEWRYYERLEWFLLTYEQHAKHQRFIRELNAAYLADPALWEENYSWEGFEWIDADNAGQSVLLYVRRRPGHGDVDVVAINLRPDTYADYRIGVPLPGAYTEVINSDAAEYGGAGNMNPGVLLAEDMPFHGQKYSLRITLPPLGGTVLKHQRITKGKKPAGGKRRSAAKK